MGPDQCPWRCFFCILEVHRSTNAAAPGTSPLSRKGQGFANIGKGAGREHSALLDPGQEGKQNVPLMAANQLLLNLTSLSFDFSSFIKQG